MEKTGKKPNIIMILADDQGPWAMHCAGTPELYTPNLDRIAEQGMRFDSFFCASTESIPARHRRSCHTAFAVLQFCPGWATKAPVSRPHASHRGPDRLPAS